MRGFWCKIQVVKQKLIFGFLIFGVIVFFWPLLFLNFAQDDFYCLLISKANSFREFLVFFTPEHSFVTSHYNFYRPLTTQFYFGIMQKIFGFNPMPFHVVSLLVHILNTFLVYKLAKEFVRNIKIAYLATFFYGFSQSLMVSIAWASNIQELVVTTLILMGIIFYKRRFNWTAVLCFILSLLSKETAITFPILIIVVTFFYEKKKDFIRLIPYFAILLIYLYFHFVKYRFVETESYTLLVNFQVLNTLRWYFWWALGLPEMFLDYIGPRFSVLPQLWKMFFKESIIIFFLFITLNLIVAVSLLTKLKKISISAIKTPLFFLLFYIIFLLPILFFPQNKYPYHQTTALAGIYIFLAILIERGGRFIMFLSIVIFALLNYCSFNLTFRTNPLVSRSRLVSINLEPFLKQYSTLPENAVIYVKNDPNYPKITESWGGTAKQVYYAVSGANSFKLYYGDKIKVYFEDVDELPEIVETSKFIEITAKVPY